jgi:2-polyprenyl-6-methoxyphenol hydroxylase-like FAD-dependent oxidoreductase
VGRVALLGDAAAGFLPTAGIGAAMAMESAWVLGSLLADAALDRVPDALHRYEASQRPRVEAAQANSRQLARLMFTRSRVCRGCATPWPGSSPWGRPCAPSPGCSRSSPTLSRPDKEPLELR